MKRFLIFMSIGLAATMNPLLAAPLDTNKLIVIKVADGLGTPWGMTFADQQHLLVTNKGGGLNQVNIHTGQKTRIFNTPKDIVVRGQAGFLDVAAAPNFTTNRWLYFTYSKDINGQGATTLARAKFDGNALTSWQDLLVTDSRTRKNQHYGSRIVFDSDGHVFFGIGDRGERDEAQDLTRHNGKILRLNLDGSVPIDNPFVDEINLIKPGKNYGWPVASFGKEYWGPVAIGEKEVRGMENALKVYVPSIAPSGLVQYKGDAFPELQGDLLTGAMALQHLNHIEMNGQEVVDEYRYLEDREQRIRNVIEGPDGFLYVANDHGEIWQIKPAE